MLACAPLAVAAGAERRNKSGITQFPNDFIQCTVITQQELTLLERIRIRGGIGPHTDARSPVNLTDTERKHLVAQLSGFATGQDQSGVRNRQTQNRDQPHEVAIQNFVITGYFMYVRTYRRFQPGK